MPGNNVHKTSWKYPIFFSTAILLGIINGMYPTQMGMTCAQFLSEIFVRLFKFISVPIIGITICLTIAKLESSQEQKLLWKRTVSYTLLTTIIAATIGAVLFYIVAPQNVYATQSLGIGITPGKHYLDYIISVIPNNPLAPFVEGNVLSILLIALGVGIAIKGIKTPLQKQTVLSFLDGIQTILFTIIKWVIAILPIGIFGFTSICVKDFEQGLALNGLGSYFAVVVGSNLVQALIILPLFLLLKRINPLKTLKNMSKALLIAFFSKSSAGTLPVTMNCAEQNNHIQPKVSRFVLPICTTINMNGCASFILITVVYLMQNNGVIPTIPLLLTWVGISTVAAIGNAGVPMGCYFLSASLLSSMNIPIQLLGIILPFYAILDMVETAVNVWSDSCIATMVNKDINIVEK